MGGVCAGGTAKNRAEIHHEHESTSGSSKKLKSVKSIGKEKKDESFSSYPDVGAFRGTPNLYDSGELYMSMSRDLKPSTPARTGGNKAPSSFLGKASIVGLEKAVEVLDTLGSSMTNLNSGGFTTGMASRGNKISILAFEVANTITKGANLLQSLSDENVEYLKKEILPSKGVQQLVSTNMKELLAIAAADKREEFDIFSREVIRFGDMCKDPQWHNLDRFFSRLDSDSLTHKQLRSEAELMMQELSTLAQYTSELYHELHALDRFEQDYRRKLEELDSLNLPRKGEGLMMLHSELRHQRKIARDLKKKSLWSKGLEEVVEKLVDIVTYIHQAIVEAFGDNGLTTASKEPAKNQERLGVAGLSLHYANLVTQIDNIASRPTSLPPNMRDGLYNGLPPSIKTALRSRLQAVDAKEELTIPQIKVEMEKTLQWLVPVATDTTKAHQGFGWVGEWANTGSEFGKKTPPQVNLIRLQTLYHADKQKMDYHVLELVTFLHRLISLVRFNGPKAFPVRSPTRKGLILQTEVTNTNPKTPKVQISVEDRNLLEKVMKRRSLVPGRSKSQEFLLPNNRKKVWALSRSMGNSPCTEFKNPKANVLDILDGLDSAF
ncbi:protein PSK SIMULATOR 2-like [Lycium barbarum]|uniref:protein PSK SIMULATOR 2-like n=1 Tax=Lycium barbarum TaxID=112863 RepID=UPI00293E7A87|nr:protein PSK SIMULATOR 2-like [Lycium barbarum]XP_060199840.1 protein PSK SIMULATOR 2-like [Lycium barbarum]XP_060199841.1 protein PSK SIMULATOR 2-like [Lycium barbarum]